MNFNKPDLQQLTSEYLDKLSKERVIELFQLLRKDLETAQERLNQNPTNSSRPSSTKNPWDRNLNPNDEAHSTDNEGSASDEESESDDKPENEEKDSSGNEDEAAQGSAEDLDKKKPKRKPGKQKGAKGFGRVQKLTITHEVIHRASCCKGCGCGLGADLPFTATGGHYTLDLKLPDPGRIGITGTNTKHIFGTVLCSCGFETAMSPKQIASEQGWNVKMGEWRLIGPVLLAYIVFLKLRMHMTVNKTGEMLLIWFGISLSDGCINTALREAGRAASYLEPEIIAAVKASNLLNVDETTWKEHKITRWFWVAVGDNAIYYTVGSRTLEMAQKILEGFKGVLMTDGYTAYRWYENRIRCWAHLDRKAAALDECWDKEAASFGAYALKTLESLRKSVGKMRKMTPEERTAEQKLCEATRLAFIYECLLRNNAEHEKTRAFAVEILNDNQAIFRVLKEPNLPLTNNLAERSLRGLVILRKMCHGSKTEEGSRTVTILASVVDTLRIRKQEIWQFLANIISLRRSGQSPPPLPSPA